ncbi:uncharacterized protein Dana_GF11445 [Drosophila ananassae]|uniref:Uncharacterized protein n=1 Tax=Drosophila ananassae TaxID=7217 RepID=B3MD50_DROAN|nr:uncharacterized protein LOC123257301 [Drosophila ananassae]EDV37383.1 uncharacterized protein Dana_GF11445 [Drosophila ananassae]
MMPNAVNPLMLCIFCLALGLLAIEARSRPGGDDRIVFPKDEDSPSVHFHYPKANMTKTTSTTEAPTTSTVRNTEPTVLPTTEEEDNGNSTAIPIIINRILIDTDKKCRDGYELHAQRCRKAA